MTDQTQDFRAMHLSGPASKSHRFEMTIGGMGQVGSKALRNICRTLEIQAQFLEEDETEKKAERDREQTECDKSRAEP